MAIPHSDLALRFRAVRWSAVVNPTAGRGRTSKALPALQSAFAAHDIPVHVSLDAVDGKRHAREAFARGDGVIACGGDGTVSSLAAVSADEQGPLAVVPTGAGNDLARHLGIPRRASDAIELIEHGRITTIDLGRATAQDGATTMFTTVANTGFDAEANRWANGVRWATGTPLYVLALLRTLAVYRPSPMRVKVDDAEWEGDAWLVAVGNTRCYAGGMMITPAAQVDDGLLDVCVILGVSKAEFLRRSPRVFKGTHTALDDVITMRGTRVEISADETRRAPELWASGERVGPLPAQLEAVPGALRVLVPEGSPLTRP
ncbi:MAG: diacylglycerol kinase family lipid kinase [Acidimicrobiia bacterium]|nr:diacylglycerol kinase family lipid kinase [Acidimicrobiia bacterium]